MDSWLKNKRIYVAGHRGLVGSAIIRCLLKNGWTDILTQTHQELDLTNTMAVETFFQRERPEIVILAAAKVGGIWANEHYPVDFLLDNLKIQNNVIEVAYRFGVEKFLFLGSSCIYPKNAPCPIKEESLLTSPLESTNEPYALAKIAGLKLCSAYRRQFGASFFSVMPCNLYGLNDNYHPQNSHVIPALIRKMHEAKIGNNPHVVLWGTGTPLREFLFSDDLANACLLLLEQKKLFLEDSGDFINVGAGSDLTISDLGQLIREVVGYEGDIIFDSNYPDGTMRKVLDTTRIKNLGWSPKVSLHDGLHIAYQDFLSKLTQ